MAAEEGGGGGEAPPIPEPGRALQPRGLQRAAQRALRLGRYGDHSDPRGESKLGVVRSVRPPLLWARPVSAQFRWRVDRGGQGVGLDSGARRGACAQSAGSRGFWKVWRLWKPRTRSLPPPHSAPAAGWAREGRGLRGRRGGEGQGGSRSAPPSGRIQKPLSPGGERSLPAAPQNCKASAAVARTSSQPHCWVRKAAAGSPQRAGPLRCGLDRVYKDTPPPRPQRAFA